MYRRVWYVLLYLTLAFSLCVPALAAPDVELSSTAIQLMPFDYDAVLNADAAEIDKILYPSGLHLPTKYCDFLDYVPYTGMRDDKTSVFLLSEYPDAKGKFTYPEYMAAKRFLYFVEADYADRNFVPYPDTFADMQDSSDWQLLSDYSNVVLTNSTHFVNALTIYKDLLLSAVEGQLTSHPQWEMFMQQMDAGFYLSLGSVTFYDYSIEDLVVDSRMFSGLTFDEYLNQLLINWDYLGCSFQSTGLYMVLQDGNLVYSTTTVVDPVIQNSSLAPDEVGSPSSSEEIKPTANDVSSEPVTEASSGVQQEVQVSRKRDLTKNSSIVEIDTTQSGILPPRKAYNLRDVIGMIAVIFSAVTVVVVWVINTIRRRKDPLYQWTRRL